MGFCQKHLLKLLKESRGPKQLRLGFSASKFTKKTLNELAFEVKPYLNNPLLADLIKESMFKEVRFIKLNSLYQCIKILLMLFYNLFFSRFMKQHFLIFVITLNKLQHLKVKFLTFFSQLIRNHLF